jgi:hypothetical protein
VRVHVGPVLAAAAATATATGGALAVGVLDDVSDDAVGSDEGVGVGAGPRAAGARLDPTWDTPPPQFLVHDEDEDGGGIGRVGRGDVAGMGELWLPAAAWGAGGGASPGRASEHIALQPLAARVPSEGLPLPGDGDAHSVLDDADTADLLSPEKQAAATAHAKTSGDHATAGSGGRGGGSVTVRLRAWVRRTGASVRAALLSTRMVATLKETFAFFVCIVPQLIPPLAAAMGQQAYLGSLAVAFGMVSGSVGRNVLNTLAINVGMLLGSAAGLAVVTVAQDTVWVMLLGLFLFDATFNLLHALRPATGLLCSLASMALVIVIMQTAEGRILHPDRSVAELSTDIALTSILSYALGAALALLVSVAVLPRLAGRKFRDQMQLVLSDVSDMLAASTIRLREPGRPPTLTESAAAAREPKARVVRKSIAKARRRRQDRWTAWTMALRDRWVRWEGASGFMRQSDGEYSSPVLGPTHAERRSSIGSAASLGDPASPHGRRGSSALSLASVPSTVTGTETTGALSARKQLIDALRGSRQAALTLTDILEEARWELGPAFLYYGYHERIIGHLRHMVRVACAIESEEFQYVLEAETAAWASFGGSGSGHALLRASGSGSATAILTVTDADGSPRRVVEASGGGAGGGSAQAGSPLGGRSPSNGMARTPSDGDAGGSSPAFVPHGPDLSTAGIMATTLPLTQLQRMFETYSLDLILRLYDGAGKHDGDMEPGSRSGSTEGTSARSLPARSRDGDGSSGDLRRQDRSLTTLEIEAGLEDLHGILNEYDRRLQETSLWIADGRAALFTASPGRGPGKAKLPDLDNAAAVGGLPYKLVAIRELLVEMLLLMETIREMHDAPKHWGAAAWALLRDRTQRSTSPTVNERERERQT